LESEAEKARLFGMQIWFVKVGLLETLQCREKPNFFESEEKKPDFLGSETKKSPTFWYADLARKSRAFGNFAKKEKSPTF